ncbi:phosphate signaling complex protein PhoU [Roseovarius sp. D22-M7]|uniref:phosphate signaling complex protein PhoU n=1 Tax=Roseovarius sp. D22-M7 TaxID=3127116 RepID=UPI0030100B49
MSEQRYNDPVFERDLEALQARIMKMGGMVERAIADAACSLETRDEELAEDVRLRDAAIDTLEETITDEATQIIALRAPVTSDLRLVLTAIRISASLDRIGDHARNVAKRTPVLADMTQVDGATAALRRMAREVGAMLKDVLDAYIQRDADLARAVIDRDEDVDQMYNAIFREFLTFMMEDPRNITPCMHLHFIAKNTERMGDLVTLIAEQVVYLASGEWPGAQRRKADRTATDPALSRHVQA